MSAIKRFWVTRPGINFTRAKQRWYGGKASASVNSSMNNGYQPQQASDKSLEAMRKFAETYAKRTDTYFCVDLGTTAVVLEGLAKHKDDYGSPLCPCRHYDDKEAEVAAVYWNCPCVPMRERRECHCMLFLTPDNPFVGTAQEISFEQIREETNRYSTSE